VLLAHVARQRCKQCWMWAVTADVVAWSVCCVCVLSRAKTVGPIEMPFALKIRVRPRNYTVSRNVHLYFTARRYASAVYAMALCLSVSVTSRSSTKMARRGITQTIPNDSKWTLVFWRQRSPRNSTGVNPRGGAKCRWSGLNRRLSTNKWLYLENGTRQTHSFY